MLKRLVWCCYLVEETRIGTKGIDLSIDSMHAIAYRQTTQGDRSVPAAEYARFIDFIWLCALYARAGLDW
jgi:hypothetical protein